jgi:hypothetical protein
MTARTVYRIVDPREGAIGRTEQSEAAERWSRAGFRVTAVTGVTA